MLCMVFLTEQDDGMCSDYEKICGGECFPEFLHNHKVLHEDAEQYQRDPDFRVHGSVHNWKEPRVELGLCFLHSALLLDLAGTK